MARVDDMLDRRWFSNDGPYVVELEERIAAYVGVQHCVAVCNGTMGLVLAARAAGLTGRVLVPSLTFIATAHALAFLGLEPVFCDVDPTSWNIDPRACEAAMAPSTSAIVGVHLYGRPCDTERLTETADRLGLTLLFDAAHAFGCTHAGRSIGSFGDAEIFSFHATKAFHTFEGGAVVTNSAELASKVRHLRNFGYAESGQVAMLGINAKMPEICAAMGLSNLESFDGTVSASRAVHAAYQAGCEPIAGLSLRSYDPVERHNWQYVVLEVDERQLGLSRDQLIAVLVAENVLARSYFAPGCHAAEPYVSADPSVGESLPETNRVAATVLVLPGGSGMSAEMASRVCEVLQTAADRSSQLRQHLDGQTLP